MNQLLNRPTLGSHLAKRRPIIKLSENFRGLAYDGCEKASMDTSEILPWSDFTIDNILVAYGDILDLSVTERPPDKVPVLDCENHCTMAHTCMAAFHIPTPISTSICLGKSIISSRLGTQTSLGCVEATHMKGILPWHARTLDFGNEDHVFVFYNANPDSINPFHATTLAVPSCTWESGSLLTANRDNQPKLGPIEQLAACAKKTNTCFSFILGDKEIVALQFFKTEAGKMGVY
ncbi:hypothetical protein FPCIR_2432 [Fusarium pseudocircinatum]|uniref:Uncharacterized protein n=1 Tax=Fusarium pseudocircinatum TaxID=56676 RepID=A0A8H5UVY6_9HYPO|nr:hypothetical protein FPCIR_2432 [Fusarium pseudocircinatum]